MRDEYYEKIERAWKPFTVVMSLMLCGFGVWHLFRGEVDRVTLDAVIILLLR